jgi:arylsulfatase
MRAGHDVLTPGERRYVSELYDAEIAYADELLGQLRSLVKESNGDRPLIFCVTADHGEEFWEHGDCGHGQSLYDELVHVPLVISAPDAEGGRRAAEPVGLIDLMPTLAELCDVAAPPDAEGRSLCPVLVRGEPPADTGVFAEANAYYEPLEAVVEGEHKLIRNVVTGRLELFNLAEDPGEHRNLAHERPAVASRLVHLLDEWRAQQHLHGSPASPRVRQESLDRLKALGYL